MTIPIVIYIFMAIATAIAVCKGPDSAEIIASVVVGLVWPLFLAVKVIQRLV